jgi:branched-chain amino acid transport system permease protein
VPRLFGEARLELGSALLHPGGIPAGLRFDSEQLGLLVTVLVMAVLLYVLLRRTFLGTSIRAVVDRRELAELAAINANRVSQVAWILGCTLAAVTGLIIPQGVLEPQKIIFFGIEAFSVAVVAKLTSIPRAILFGLLVLGVTASLLDIFEPFGLTGGAAETYQAIVTNLSVIVLFGALVLFRKLDEVGETGTTGQGLVGSFGRRQVSGAGLVAPALLTIVALWVPFFLGSADLRLAQVVMALIVIFVSIVCITGYSGHLTLGQASIAGLGAFFSARAANGLDIGPLTIDLPVLLAMLFGAGVALLAGLAAGYPAMRRKGLFLGLTTLGLALIIDRFVFNAQLFAGGPGGLEVHRPAIFGIDLRGDRAFYYFEMVVVLLVLVLAYNLRSGRLGRVLGAMRDSETAAQSVGIGLRRAKLFVFAVSSAMAGIGGALLTQSEENWDTTTFNPIFGLFWFVVVVVCGIGDVRGAILAAVLYVLIPRQLDLPISSAIGLFGIAALFLGRMPGGLVGQLGRIKPTMQAKLAEQYRRARQPKPEAPAPPVPTDFAERILTEAGR